MGFWIFGSKRPKGDVLMVMPSGNIACRAIEMDGGHYRDDKEQESWLSLPRLWYRERKGDRAVQLVDALDATPPDPLCLTKDKASEQAINIARNAFHHNKDNYVLAQQHDKMVEVLKVAVLGFVTAALLLTAVIAVSSGAINFQNLGFGR